ncbi:hypothetical protein V6667_09650 [Neisseria leonii]|uniref:Periplasmic protein n=1 Tax=Neisseria leonii TaxID=2995413 RepID=A0A9X4E3F9_9NEIS|nr:hypothetical protein [Neisseria sp. 51.81]MDD9328728.1 hypothetical protein [Neisseria sp. 51.81]
MKKAVWTVLLAVLPPGAAAEGDLISAQAAFRQALAVQNTDDARMVKLQTDLAAAQKRKADADADIGRLNAELEAAKQQKAANDEILKQAGERLNRAWQAAKGQ